MTLLLLTKIAFAEPPQWASTTENPQLLSRGDMQRGDRKQLRTRVSEMERWVATARAVQSRHSDITKSASAASSAIKAGSIQVRSDSTVAWKVIPLRSAHIQRLNALATAHAQRPLAQPEQQLIDTLLGRVETSLADVPAALSAKRFVIGKKKRDRADEAALFLHEYWKWAQSAALPTALSMLESDFAPPVTSIHLGHALSDEVGFGERLAVMGEQRTLIPANSLAALPATVVAINSAARAERFARAEAKSAAAAVKEKAVKDLLAQMSVDALKDASEGRLPIGPFKDAGIYTVADVERRGNTLANLPGIGEVSARRIRGAARTLVEIAADETPVRIDPDNRTPQVTTLLSRLAGWDAVRHHGLTAEDLAMAESLAGVASVLGADALQLIVIGGSRTPQELTTSVDMLSAHAARVTPARHVDQSIDPWLDFHARSADYYSMLDELGYLSPSAADEAGDLPDDVLAAIREFELDTTHLAVSLRGYQRFAAAFALVQRKVVIGDEMGLGKTVEALAAMAHLKAGGDEHFVVVCPAAVVTNWVREIGSKSTLTAHRLHGPDRLLAARAWVKSGGVAVTTFETLEWAQSYLAEVPRTSCVVVDEAHYIKNPEAKRSRRSRRLIDRSDHAILLTGTPMENRLGEFQELVGYLRPDLITNADAIRPRQFRMQVAPAYLRRNQEDVLSELPDLVEVDEWLPMSSEDETTYRAAVDDGNFMAMRRAAMLSPRSEKVKRLIEIVREAEESGRRVIVYSYFLNVLDLVAKSLPGQVYGPLTGAVPAAKRQDLVDQFSASHGGAVLVAQIQAGGVGLNVQAASVVVICEPQLKPTTEWQAIARAHRMGQLQSVQVHRLLTEDSVDQRVRSLLQRKTQLFDDFARVSELAESAPEAFDITEAEIAREVIAAERERLGLGALVGSA